MDTNMTFRMHAEGKAQMAALCSQLGMTPSTPSNIFANAFVRRKGMPFPVAIQEPVQSVSRAKMLADADQILSDFAADYEEMAK